MNLRSSARSDPPLLGVLAAFGAVYVIWGSTYLGIRYAVESIPPFLMAGSRFLTAGLVLYAFAVSRGAGPPTLPQWRDAAVAGFLMLLVGNGGVTWAEQFIPSSVAALIVALIPLWMVLFDWWRPGGRRPGVLIFAGLVVGFSGVLFLVRKPGNGEGHAYAWGVLALVVATFCWALGSMFNRRTRKPASPLQAVAMQMMAGGALMLLLGLVSGETRRFSWQAISAVSAWAWVYLTLIGSLVGFTAYVWLLHASTPARVSTYAFVNPLIAVLLGCTIGREPFTPEILVAACLITTAVALIVAGGIRRPKISVSTPGALEASKQNSPLPCMGPDAK